MHVNYFRLIARDPGPELPPQVNQVVTSLIKISWVGFYLNSSGKQRTPHNGSLSRAGSMSSINLDSWDMMEAEAGDEKDRRIRELEETLRKQKELMEILQRKLNDTPSSVKRDLLHRYSDTL